MQEPESAFRALGERAHAWPAPNLFFGGVHAARRFSDGGVEGAGDPRRGGVAICGVSCKTCGGDLPMS